MALKRLPRRLEPRRGSDARRAPRRASHAGSSICLIALGAGVRDRVRVPRADPSSGSREPLPETTSSSSRSASPSRSSPRSRSASRPRSRSRCRSSSTSCGASSRPRSRSTRSAIVAVFVAFATVLFAVGVAFGYFVVLPRALDFLTNYDDDVYDIQIRASYYFSFVTLDAARDRARRSSCRSSSSRSCGSASSPPRSCAATAGSGSR